MAGTDTTRGINFQYAAAISILLEFAKYPEWDVIQMEGDVDIEDVVVFNKEGKIVLRAQIKQKKDPNQWKPAEFRDVIRRLVDCLDCIETTEYQFIYSGSEGTTLVALRPLLEKLRVEGLDALQQEEKKQLVDKLDDETLRSLGILGSRFRLIQKDSRDSVEIRNLRNLRKLLAEQGKKRPEEDYEETLHKSLFHEIAGKSEGTVKYSRQMKRDEVFRLLEIQDKKVTHAELNSLEYNAWLEQNATRVGVIAELNVQPEQAISEILEFALRLDQEGSSTSGESSPDSFLTPWSAIQANPYIVLVGDSGSGKTTSLWQIMLRYCKLLLDSPSTGAIPVLIDLVYYNGESVPELIRQSFQLANQFVDIPYIEDLARAGRLVLLFDAIDYAQSNNILLEINRWNKLYPQCKMVVTSQRSSDGRLLRVPTFRLRPLTEEQAKSMLMEIPELDRGDLITLWHAPSQDFKHLVTNPLMLRMLAYTYIHLGKRMPLSRGKLYQDVVDAITTYNQTNIQNKFDKSDKMVVLSLLARWMQENKIYSLPLSKLGSLLNEWTEDGTKSLSHLKGCDYVSLRQELTQSGVIRIATNGEAEFVHHSFMAYFAALTVQLDEILILIPKQEWRASLLFWSSMHDLQTTETLLEAAIVDKLFLGQIIVERSDIRVTQTRQLRDVQQYFEQFNQYLQSLLNDISALILGEPWSKLKENRLQLSIAENESAGYIAFWDMAKNKSRGIEWLKLTDLSKHMSKSNVTFPLQVSLFARTLCEKYHPLELAYLWTMRALFDILHFSSVNLDLKTTSSNISPDLGHPAIKLLFSRFILYQQLASELPIEIAKQLPFYASKEFDLIIEVHTYLSPAVICCAFSAGREQGMLAIVPSVIGMNNQDDAAFYQNDGGKWLLDTEKVIGLGGPVLLIETMAISDLLLRSPDSWAHQELNSQLTKMLPGYPPNLW